ncbi:MAG: glycosyltransferase family 2 protein [Patescibacteria group bacterium]|nr:glycosyltransferase family 2 protein [Patescibacteria group bacterium]
MEKEIISIIILSWNTKDILKNCLRSIEYPKFGKWVFEVIVIDNGSTDGSAQMVEKDFREAVLVKNKKNLGYGAGNNIGIKKAKGEYLLFLNSDTLIKGDAIEEMAGFLKLHPDTGMVGPKLLNEDGSDQPSAGKFPGLRVSFVMLFAERFLGSKFARASYDKIKQVDWVMGAAMMTKKDVVERAGVMDEGIFMYMDEVEWCYRIKKQGFKIVFLPDPEVIHLWQKSSVSGREAPILNIYKGLIYFYKKHLPFWKLPVLMLMLKVKALTSIFVGVIFNNAYLKKTYAKALKIN